MNWTYAAIMLSAIAAAAALTRVTQRDSPLSRFEKLGLGIGAFCGAMIGSKLPFLLLDSEGLRSGSAWLADGKTIMCGLVGGYLGVELAKWALEIRVKTGDGYALPVAAAVAIGRLGCFQAGCCYGRETTVPWGVQFPATAGPEIRHPTQLYEFAFHAIAAVLLYLAWRRGWFRFQLLKLYIIAYLAYRFGSEFLRPEPAWWWGLSVYQWLALLWMPVFVGLWIYDARKYGHQQPADESLPDRAPTGASTCSQSEQG